MPPKINGTLEPVRQPAEVKFDPTSGTTVRQPWESAGDNLNSMAQSLFGSRIAYEFTRSPTKSRLVAEASGGIAGYPDVVVDTWQVLANEIQKDVRESQLGLAIENYDAAHAGAGTTIGYVKRDVDLFNQGKGPGSPAPDAGIITQAAQLFRLLIKGTTHFATGQYVLKHTTSVSNQFGGNISDFNIECIYSTAQLITEISNPNLWIFPCPGRLQTKILNIVAPPAHSEYLWGWRKLPSTETTAAGYRIEISTEYWLEQWSTVLYNLAS
jgi:hypothetical protein